MSKTQQFYNSYFEKNDYFRVIINGFEFKFDKDDLRVFIKHLSSTDLCFDDYVFEGCFHHNHWFARLKNYIIARYNGRSESDLRILSTWFQAV